MRHSKYTRWSEHGFSLIEMLVVILIIGLLVAIAGVNVSKYRKSIEADTVATQYAQYIRQIRDRAITERVTFRLRILPGTAVTNVSGDQYILERFPKDPKDASTDPASPKVLTLPRGWRFGKLSSAASVPDPNNLPEISYTYSGSGGGCAILFKGDGILGDGNAISTPSSNIRTPPLNRTIYLYDSEEGDQLIKQYKPRAITVLGATGRTAIWRLFKDQWKVPGR